MWEYGGRTSAQRADNVSRPRDVTWVFRHPTKWAATQLCQTGGGPQNAHTQPVNAFDVWVLTIYILHTGY
jgi:hypothetical protein